MNRYLHSIAVAAGLLAFLAASGSPIAGEEPTRAQKTEFLSALCDGLENAERCLSSGKIVLDLSLDWVMFEACSYSGENPTMVRCFDRGTSMAASLTGDPKYRENLAYCHRFQGEGTNDATVRCYREGFKYPERFLNEKYGNRNAGDP